MDEPEHANGREHVTFYYDFACAEAYLAAERIVSVLGLVPEFQPIQADHLSLQTAGRCQQQPTIEVRAKELGLQPLRWPSPFPPNSEFALLVATYAKQIGRVVAFSLAAFRQAYAGGHDLGDSKTVLIAAAAAEMHPTAVLKGANLRSIRARLVKATGRAVALGVKELPAIVVGNAVYSGVDALEEAAATTDLNPH